VEGSHGQPLKQNIIKVCTSAFLSLIPLIIIISIWGKNILNLISKEYTDAYDLLILVIASSFFIVIYMVYISVQNINMRVERNIKFNLLRFILLIGASFYLIPRYNINGVGYAWLLTHVILTLLITVTFMKTAIIKIKGLINNSKIIPTTGSVIRELLLKFLSIIKAVNPMKYIHIDDKFNFTEKILVIMLFVSAVLGSAGPVLFKQFNLALLGTYLSFPMLSASIIWLSIRNKNTTVSIIKENLNLLFILMYLLCCLFSILILYFVPVRTISYYILIAVMGVLIILQILYSAEITKKQSKIILLQIVFLFLNIIWGVTLKYYLFIGRTDGLFHSWAIENLLNNGFINQTFDIYDAFPLWHILCSFIYKIINMPLMPAKVMFLINGLIYGCLVIIIYLVASKIFNNKIALLSSLLLCFNTDAVFYGMYSIPRSVIFFLESLLIFLLLQQKTVINITLCIVTIIGLILYHTASIPFIIIILILFYLLQAFYAIDNQD
jgi:hypothetical protein